MALDLCRICHGGPDKGELNIYCKCVGNNGAQHLKCLQKWIKMGLDAGMQRTKCEICLHPYAMNLSKTFSCGPCLQYTYHSNVTPDSPLQSNWKRLLILLVSSLVICGLDIWSIKVLCEYYFVTVTEATYDEFVRFGLLLMLAIATFIIVVFFICVAVLLLFERYWWTNLNLVIRPFSSSQNPDEVVVISSDSLVSEGPSILSIASQT